MPANPLNPTVDSPCPVVRTTPQALHRQRPHTLPRPAHSKPPAPVDHHPHLQSRAEARLHAILAHQFQLEHHLPYPVLQPKKAELHQKPASHQHPSSPRLEPVLEAGELDQELRRPEPHTEPQPQVSPIKRETRGEDLEAVTHTHHQIHGHVQAELPTITETDESGCSLVLHDPFSERRPSTVSVQSASTNSSHSSHSSHSSRPSSSHLTHSSHSSHRPRSSHSFHGSPAGNDAGRSSRRHFPSQQAGSAAQHLVRHSISTLQILPDPTQRSHGQGNDAILRYLDAWEPEVEHMEHVACAPALAGLEARRHSGVSEYFGHIEFTGHSPPKLDHTQRFADTLSPGESRTPRRLEHPDPGPLCLIIPPPQGGEREQAQDVGEAATLVRVVPASDTTSETVASDTPMFTRALGGVEQALVQCARPDCCGPPPPSPAIDSPAPRSTYSPPLLPSPLPRYPQDPRQSRRLSLVGYSPPLVAASSVASSPAPSFPPSPMWGHRTRPQPRPIQAQTQRPPGSQRPPLILRTPYHSSKQHHPTSGAPSPLLYSGRLSSNGEGRPVEQLTGLSDAGAIDVQAIAEWRLDVYERSDGVYLAENTEVCQLSDGP